MFPLKPSNVKIPGNKAKKVEAHTAPMKFGMGSYYGRAMKNPFGRMRDSSVGFRPVTKKQLGKPPKSVV
jgi:hypothetical protein